MHFQNLGYILGFSPEQVISKTTKGPREVDLEHSYRDLYIYCDIIQQQYVGDALVPLLRIIPVEGKDGQRISKSFLRPQYVPVSPLDYRLVAVGELACLNDPESYTVGGLPSAGSTLAGRSKGRGQAKG